MQPSTVTGSSQAWSSVVAPPGWFLGFKLHLRINHKGRMVAFKITDGSSEDRKPCEDLTAARQGKVFADRGYLAKLLLERHWQRVLHVVTGLAAP